MTIYILLLIILLILSIIVSDRSVFGEGIQFNLKIFYAFITLFLILIAGFREIGVSVDDLNYLNIYNSANRGNVYKDIAFVFLSRTFPSFQLLVLFMAILSISLKGLFFINKLKYLGLGFLLYYTSYYFLHDFVQIRAAIASGLLLWIIYFSAERRLFLFILLCVLAVSFHLSALIFIPFFFHS